MNRSTTSTSKIVFITGASHGIGRAVAQQMHEKGYTVYGTGRTWDHPGGYLFHQLQMDLQDEDSIRRAVESTIEESGRIDILINNAGVTHFGTVEECPLDSVREMFEVNYIGTLSVIQKTLPHMRKQKSGLIVNISTLAGKIGIPFQSQYAVSKWALEGLSESLKHELESQNIRVIVIEPGDVKTTIWSKRNNFDVEHSAYKRGLEMFLATKEVDMGHDSMSPEAMAVKMVRVIESGRKKFRYPLGTNAKLFMTGKDLFPNNLFFWFVRQKYKTWKF